MIERGDAIRRPVDSSLASREVHRGVSGMPVAQQEVLAQVRQQSPVLAVVVEQTALGTAQKPLFDLLLKVNDQWLQARTEQSFKPGTVLMIEAGQGNQLLALSRPDASQLQQMMQASLSFWQAHTLPKVHPTQLPPLPATPVLNSLVQQHPNLAPLVDWLTQRSTADSANLMRWITSFQPLSTARATALPTQVGPGSPTTIATSAGTAAGPIAGAGTPVGHSALVSPTTQAPALLSSALQPLSSGAQPLTPTAQSLPMAQPLTPLISNANAPTDNSGAIKAAVTAIQHQLPLPLVGNARLAVQATPQTPAPLLPAGAQQVLSQALAGLSTLPADPATLPTEARTLQTGTQSTAQGNPTGPIGQSLWQNLSSPADSSAKSTENNPLPIEIRLGQWLTQIDQAVRQQPTTLKEALALKAQQLLSANDASRPVQQPTITQTQQTGTPLRQDTQEPLLQLRQFLEGVQAKVQNNAIQQSFSTLTQPDIPQVQQLSIPLIWLGVTAWANLEWWQEKRERKEEQSRRSGDRLWRFRLFLELKPLAPLCADLSWHNHEAQVIFWSQDPGTLNLLNQHMDQLTAWTEGMGERQFTTRHGMPPKKTTPKADDFQPLVDIHT